MAEARAAMHLREYVNDDDIDCAIRCVRAWVPPPPCAQGVAAAEVCPCPRY